MMQLSMFDREHYSACVTMLCLVAVGNITIMIITYQLLNYPVRLWAF